MSTKKIVNVASVPKRSPFRYPGGKTWLVPLARKWWRSLDRRPNLLIEAFAGGGIIGLTAAFEGFVDHVILVERDPDVSAVWTCICSSEFQQLANRILKFEVTEENVRDVLANDQTEIIDIAFRTILKNRMFHGGILAPGASLMKSGENGKGLKSRWYAKTLADRIDAIGNLRDKFTVVQGDGIEVLDSHKNNRNAVFFIDPPYTAAGKKAGTRLYRFSELDHNMLFDTSEKLAGDFLMTYDDAEGVAELARTRKFDMELVAMKNTHHAKMKELLIGRDLQWARTEVSDHRQFEFKFEPDDEAQE
jgi:DNA adenine methylase